MIEAAFKLMIESCDSSPATFADRVYPLVLPQDYTPPSLTYQIISGPRDYTQDGPDGVTTWRIQVDVWSPEYAEVVEVRNLLVAGMSGAHNVTFGGVKFLGVFMDSERDLFDSGVEPPGPRLFRKSIDFMVTAKHG